jgi:ribosomal protein S1
VQEGIVGLLHESEFTDLDTGRLTPVPQVGDEIVVEITDINFMLRRASLSLHPLMSGQ